MTKKIVVVGPIAQWQAAKKQLPDVDGVVFVDLSELTAQKLAEEDPDFVISALLNPAFDALDVARVLSDLGYRGCYRAVTDVLPNAGLIATEVASIAPELDFDVFQIAPRQDA